MSCRLRPRNPTKAEAVPRKLIETAMPLDVVSRNASREKSVRHGHPSTLHLWWSRKPLAAARAVLFAQLVDDPADRPDLFPTAQAQDAERDRLLDLVGRLSAWDATVDEPLMRQARREVEAACGPDGVVVWDPFAGGGSIPLEGQRLGLPVVSSDLNPVAVLLQRAGLELPRRWRGRDPVGQPARQLAPADDRALGLAADVRHFGEQVLRAAATTLRPLYPTLTWDGREHEVAAYLWVRTVACGNPACGATVAMLSNPWLRRKKGQETWLRACWRDGALQFEVVDGTAAQQRSGRGAVFSCVACGTPTTAEDVQRLAKADGLGRALRCVVPDAGPRRPFLVVPQASVSPADDDPAVRAQPGELDLGLDVLLDPLVTNAPTYGVRTIEDLHLPRQRAALTAFAAAVRAITPSVRQASLDAGWSADDARPYADDVTLLLGLVLGRLANRMSTACVWNAHLGLVEQTFIQNNAIAFPWDFAEANPLSTASGSWPSQLDWVARVIERADPAADAVAVQRDARTPPPALAGRRVVVSTDPPYFDYFVYSSLSDYFYVWLRAALRGVAGDLFATMTTPRDAEIVMRDGRGGGTAGSAREEFLAGLTAALTSIRQAASPEYPVTIYYAYKSTAATGAGLSAWAAFLAAVRAAGLVVTATWPIRTERTEGIKTGTNSLASSIVVACRRRPPSASATDRRTFIAELRREVPRAVARLQRAGTSPVDLDQAALGPAMAVFTRYPDVVDTDGASMPVGVALDLVNQVLGESLAGQEGDLDAVTRFCLAWFDTHGLAAAPFGDADRQATLANTSVEDLVRHGVLRAVAGRARLVPPADYPDVVRLDPDRPPTVWEVVFQLTKRLADGGAPAAAALLASVSEGVDVNAGRELAYLLYAISDRRKWPPLAASFNDLATTWNDLTPA
jgi:putative DNA methylase